MSKLLSKNEVFIAFIILGLVLIIGAINPNFFTRATLYDMLRSSVVMGIFGVGVLMVLVSGGIDISFTAIAAFCMYVTTRYLKAIGFEGSVLLAMAISGGLGILLGMINAVLISSFRLPTLIVTLGTSNMFRGFMLAFIGTKIISVLPPGMVRFSRMELFPVTTMIGGTNGLSVSIFVLAVVAPVTWLILKYTMLGRGIYALGGDQVAAERAGLNVRVIQFFVYCYVGFLAGVAGIVHASLIRTASPFDLVGTELSVIAAVVLGGARITGGHGTILGAMLGVFLVVVMNNSLIMMGVPSYWQSAVIGIIIIIGTSITAFQSKRTGRVSLVEME